MARSVRTLLLALGVGLVLPLSAQPPAGAPPAGAPPPGAARPGPQNLKVLPQDADLRTIMRGFTGALGVECEFCHAAADPVTHRADRASDANPMKDTARYMIRMTGDLNTKYLAQLPMPASHAGEAPPTITCGTCHRGEKEPSAFVPPPRQPGNGPGGPPPAGAPPAPRPGN